MIDKITEHYNNNEYSEVLNSIDYDNILQSDNSNLVFMYSISLFNQSEYLKADTCLDHLIDINQNINMSSLIFYWKGKIYDDDGKGFMSDEKENPLYDKKTAKKYYLQSLGFDYIEPYAIYALEKDLNDDLEFAISLLLKIVDKLGDKSIIYLRLAEIYGRQLSENDKFIYYLNLAWEFDKKVSIGTLYVINLASNISVNKDKIHSIFNEIDKNTVNDYYTDIYYKVKGAYLYNIGDYSNAKLLFSKVSRENKFSKPYLELNIGLCDLALNNTIDWVNYVENLNVEDLISYLEYNPGYEVENSKFRIGVDDLFSYEFACNAISTNTISDSKRYMSKNHFLVGLFSKNIGHEYDCLENYITAMSILNNNALVNPIVTSFIEIVKNVPRLKKDKKTRAKIISLFSDLLNTNKLFRELLVNDELEWIIPELFHAESYDALSSIMVEQIKTDTLDGENLFKVAYSHNNNGKVDLGKALYMKYLKKFGENSSVLNNLGVIYEGDNMLEESLRFFKRAKAADPNDEKVNSNIDRIKLKLDNIQKEKEEISLIDSRRENYFQIGLQNLKRDNDFIIEKVSFFYSSILALPNSAYGEPIAIPRYQLAQFLKLKQDNAVSLVKQFVEKGYLYETGERNNHRVKLYLLNPYLENTLKEKTKERNIKVDPMWIENFSKVNVDALESFDYFSFLEKLERVNKKFRPILVRDFKELTFNYLMGNYKSVVVLSGSLVECLLIYNFEKKKISTIAYVHPDSGKTKRSKIYKSDLIDLLTFAEQEKFFGNDVPHLGNLLRIYRNFIHPGLELRQTVLKIDKNKSEISYTGVLEMIRASM